MTPEIISTIFDRLILLIPVLVTAWITIRNAKDIKKTKEDVAQVKNVDIPGVHELVDGKYSKLLEMYATLAKEKAVITGTEGDKALAEKAITDAKLKIT